MESRPNRPAGIPSGMRVAHSHPRPQTIPPHRSTPPSSPPSTPATPKRSTVGFIIGLVSLIIATLVITGFGIMALIKEVSTVLSINSSGYQSVYLTNNMVYFGKLSKINNEFVTLSDVYYLPPQSEQNNQADQQNNKQPQYSLVKLGGALHGPEDTIHINKKEILYWENNGKATQAIKNYQTKNGIK
jgi:hypothetical protein